MSLGERIKTERIAQGMSQAQLAEASGVKQQMISKLEVGKAKGTSDLVAIAWALRVSPHWLMTGEGAKYGHPDRPGASASASNVADAPEIKRMVPLISWVQAGQWSEAVDLYAPGDAEDWVGSIGSHGPHTFALRVEGDSMTASHGKSYPDGCLIYVDPDLRGGVVSGDRVIARLEHSDHVTFKVLAEDAGRRFLRPLNPQYPVITEPFTIIGKIVCKVEPE